MGGPKVLICCSESLHRRDGTSTRTIWSFKALKNSFDTRLLVPDEKSLEVIPDSTRDIHDLRPRWKSLWPLELMRYLRRNDFHVVICENDWRWLPVILLLSRIRGYKVAFEAHGILSVEMMETGTGRANERFNRLREKILLPRCDLVIPLSQDIDKFYKRLAKKTEIVRSFIDRAPSDREHRDASSSHTKLVGVIGPFDTARNMSTLKFLERNIDRFPESVQFVIIGKCGHRIDHPRMRFTGFIESAEEYQKTISTLDAVLVAEGTATSGPLTKILEPMSYGIPVFTNPKGLIGLDFAENGLHVFVAEDDDIPDLVAKTLADKDSMYRVGLHARELVEKYYCFDNGSKRLVSVISELARSKAH